MVDKVSKNSVSYEKKDKPDKEAQKKKRANKNCCVLDRKIDEVDIKIKCIVKCAKSKYYSQLFPNASTKETRKQINKVISENKKCDHISLKAENQNDNSEDSNISNAFGEYFSTIGQKFSDKIPSENGDHPNKLNTLEESTPSIFLRPTTVNEIELLISALRVNKACGIDDISALTIN